MTPPATTLLPPGRSPRIERLGRLSARFADSVDAILAITPVDASPELFATLPHAQIWARMLAGRTRSSRSAGGRTAAAAAGAIRTGNLANARQTRLILGVMPRNASAFETLSLAGRMARDLGSCTPESVVLAAPSSPQGSQDGALEALLSATLACAFEMPSFRSSRRHAARLQQVGVLGGSLDLKRIQAAAQANGLARWLTALPPNKLDAGAYQRVLRRLARHHGLKFRWISEGALKRRGAGAFVAVSQGNARRTAGIAHLSYRPARQRRAGVDVALVGKGILFDTGGTNLKTHRGMLDMHTDMNGSAVAVATLCALADLRSPLAVDAWLAISENRTGPTAFVPQDVVTASNGVSIQVIHTDAEGRMVLADTLALAGRTRPGLIVDFATLTGACVTALGERMSGIFVRPPALAATALAAGIHSGERVWNFPLDADYDGELESRVADVMQCTSDSKADHILAARFLSRFVPEDCAWIHMDLSAAVRSGGLAHVNTDITGFGVRYTLELLRSGKVPR
ncbi:MAG TPA: leucyl aminopeptidase family protein [Steroidobacteraceae bacterium]|nr:leucyl aminopeptidase family protein [Steroidobacteraceae bacterium]